MKPSHACFVLICCGAGLGSCSNGTEAVDPTLPAACQDIASRLTVKDRMGQPASSFTPGEPVTLEMQITNTSNRPHTFHNADACGQVRFEVRDSSDQTVWASDAGLACAQVITDITYGPRHTATLTGVWQQQLPDGSQAPTGLYVAQAIDKTQCSTSLSKTAGLTLQ